METAEITTQKITNPNYIGQLAPYIQDYIKRIKPVSVTYETLYTHLVNMVQFGGEAVEIWVAYIDDTPAGFAMWSVAPPPHISKVWAQHIYTWVKDKKVMEAFLPDFEAFAKKHRAVYLHFSVRNEAVYRRFRVLAKKYNYEILDEEQINFVGRKKGGI